MTENKRLTYRGNTPNIAYSDYSTREIINRLAEYEEIGTIKEFKALKEKNEPKKVVFAKNMMTKEKVCYCSSCRRIVESVHIYCWNCGQKLNWQ